MGVAGEIGIGRDLGDAEHRFVVRSQYIRFLQRCPFDRLWLVCLVSRLLGHDVPLPKWLSTWHSTICNVTCAYWRDRVRALALVGTIAVCIDFDERLSLNSYFNETYRLRCVGAFSSRHGPKSFTKWFPDAALEPWWSKAEVPCPLLRRFGRIEPPLKQESPFRAD